MLTGSTLRYNRQLRVYGDVIQVKFRIHPDGRVEEQVIGIQGADCTKVTEELNEKLGEVIDTAPTEEMFQEKVTVDETNQVYEQKYTEW